MDPFPRPAKLIANDKAPTAKMVKQSIERVVVRNVKPLEQFFISILIHRAPDKLQLT